jgi:hypothetical protein
VVGEAEARLALEALRLDVDLLEAEAEKRLALLRLRRAGVTDAGGVASARPHHEGDDY